MRNPLGLATSLRQLVVVCLALPLIAILVVLAFAWPAGRTAPRDVPLGIVDTGAPAQSAVEGITRSERGAFDLHLYPDDRAARSAIENRDVYGALQISASSVTAYEASAASPAVAQLVTEVGQNAAAQGRIQLQVVDVVPLAESDPRGTVFASALLPLTIFGTVLAALVTVLLGFRTVWHKAGALVVASAIAGFGVWLVAQGYLGALPNDAAATWAALALMILAISTTVAGLYSLFGSIGLAGGSALVVFVGNAFSGVTSAPELLPTAARHLGQWLPPGAGANLLRRTAYFGGSGAGVHLAVLIAWVAFGLGSMIVGHHTFAGFAARTAARTTPLSSSEGRHEAREGGPDRDGAPDGAGQSVAWTPPIDCSRPTSHTRSPDCKETSSPTSSRPRSSTPYPAQVS